MKFDANLMLAITSVIALTLLTMVASVVGPAGAALKYVLTAALSCLGFLVLNRLYMRLRSRKPKTLISREAPATIIVAMVFPLAMILSAALPLLNPTGDYGLMLVMGGVWTGLTLQSLLASRVSPE